MLSFYRARYLFDTGPGRWLYRASVLERTPEELEAEFNNEYAGEDPGPGRLVGRDRELMDGIEDAIKPVKEAPALGAATDVEDDILEID